MDRLASTSVDPTPAVEVLRELRGSVWKRGARVTR
jgi:hypothetical protein